MSRFRIKKKGLHHRAGVDADTWQAVVSKIELLGGATEEDFLEVCTLVADMYQHPIECPRCHQQSWQLYGFVEPRSENEVLWLPGDGSTHYRLCEVPSCGHQDLSKFSGFIGSRGQFLEVSWFGDLVVAVELKKAEDVQPHYDS